MGVVGDAIGGLQQGADCERVVRQDRVEDTETFPFGVRLGGADDVVTERQEGLSVADMTRTLPPDDVPVRAPAIVTLSEVLCRSIEQTLAYVYQATPEPGLKVVQRVHPDGSEGVYVAFPNYWSAPAWEAFRVAFDNGAAQPLTHYLWQCGMPRITLTGPDPDAQSWARFVAYQYIAQPIRYLLVDRSITLAVDGKEPWPAKLDPEAVREFALRAARDI